MKKMNMKWLLFLVLILALSSGLSYLALNHVTTTKNADNAQNMTIALVNEDEGAVFNNERLVFGDAFVRSLDTKDDYDWYVVSRGVAESGLERQLYDMMIIIPNDFSEKALSIDSDNPERVTLKYKINASDNDEVKAQAEKTASQILNDFNRRIIDVYFASIIGNLQDAQDNIASIVEKQGIYTDTYNMSINNPLANYTNQFETVKDFSEQSKNSFGNFEIILESFQDRLAEGADSNQHYLTNINNMATLKEANNLLFIQYLQSLTSFDAALHDRDTQQQLDQLQLANSNIFYQFKLHGDETATIVTDAAVLQNYFDHANELVRNVETNLVGTLESDMEARVAEQLSAIFADAFSSERINLNSLLESPDKNVHRIIQKQINQLPSLNANDIDGSGLSEQTVTELKNVIAVTRKYNREFSYSPAEPDKSGLLSSQIKEIKERLADTGVTMTNSVILPENKRAGQTFQLSIPDEYELQGLWLTLPGAGEADYTQIYRNNQEINLPANGEGVFTVKLNLRLKNVNRSMDVFQPATWSWSMEQKDITDVDHPENISPLTSAAPAPENDVAEAEKESPVEEQEASKEEELEIQTNAENVEVTTASEEEDAPGNDEEDNGGGNNDDNNDETPEPIVERVTVINNYIHHQVMSPLLDDGTQRLINAADNTVSEYQRMLALYEMYFGLNMEHPQLQERLAEKTLAELATDSSLYYLFNVKELDDLLTNYVVSRVTAGVTKEIRQPLRNFYEDVAAYRQQADAAERKTDEMAEKINVTMEQAAVMNSNLADLLEDVADWREKSMSLVNEQHDIQSAGNEEQAVMMALEGDFQPLLMISEQLADQARNNMADAESVYQTFDLIDDQANSIQESGVGLVAEAEELSTNMTNKLLEDEKFVENFAGVLANSRIGERDNENLYDFLSNPVETVNEGTIVSGDTFTPYFVVLISFVVALFTAYVISTSHQKRLDKDAFDTEKTFIAVNAPIAAITAGIGLIEGLITGLLSGYYLQMHGAELIGWTTLVTLTVAATLMLATYLLRQLKMAGMFLLLVIFSLYLFLTRALGPVSGAMGKLRAYSPLQHVENLFAGAINGTANYQAAIFILVGISIVVGMANLLVFTRSPGNEGIDDESTAKTH
ncbi:type VII secretion protein EsaA, N-terminal domain-containing protein [Evansella caseinilytica]|uniref:Type VII secretion system accessory factor EsaA n=1 Tax=Evansella caseinilytica TaxID=1503961 RepID=A0A1H3TKB5_9BACI|nr:type VII secretion protein EsaA [Evansella caseinilytica]SDZ50437.1 type VII secretion protein EsaA, N-terminal domain-containing protein [Evansella caseinilytica]